MPALFDHNQYYFRKVMEEREKSTTTTTTVVPTRLQPKISSSLPALVGKYQNYFLQRLSVVTTTVAPTVTTERIRLPPTFEKLCRARAYIYSPYQFMLMDKISKMCSKFM